MAVIHAALRTEGLLGRRLLGDPLLRGVGAVILDECQRYSL